MYINCALPFLGIRWTDLEIMSAAPLSYVCYYWICISLLLLRARCCSHISNVTSGFVKGPRSVKASEKGRQYKGIKHSGKKLSGHTGRQNQAGRERAKIPNKVQKKAGNTRANETDITRFWSLKLLYIYFSHPLGFLSQCADSPLLITLFLILICCYKLCLPCLNLGVGSRPNKWIQTSKMCLGRTS